MGYAGGPVAEPMGLEPWIAGAGDTPIIQHTRNGW